MEKLNKKPLPRYIAWVYSRGAASSALNIISRVLVALSVLGFIGGAVYIALKSPLGSVLFIVFCAVPYAAVTLLRVWLNCERPYEVYDFGKIRPPHKRVGRSMPSRHVFSAFVIGTLSCFVHLPLGVCVLSFGVCIAIFRVLLGIHFIRDVLVGALIGAVSGVVGGIIINNFLG